jgi:hypothetical protein
MGVHESRTEASAREATAADWFPFGTWWWSMFGFRDFAFRLVSALVKDDCLAGVGALEAA